MQIFPSTVLQLIQPVRVAFNEELMSLIRQPGAHHFEAPGWNLLRDVLCVSQ